MFFVSAVLWIPSSARFQRNLQPCQRSPPCPTHPRLDFRGTLPTPEPCQQDLKTTTNLIFNLTGAPPECWLFCLQYVAYILNHTATHSIGWRTPLEKLTGVTPDISRAITHFNASGDRSTLPCMTPHSLAIPLNSVAVSSVLHIMLAMP
eukprot:Nitzschia sp. Nitz4//scaffold415_size9299//3222//3668//NITZ4_009102-RA/size9299-exonerate_protein2genome-gene-0.3-mRNA-1//1//CDS//3329551360//529//frame0